MIKNRPHRPKEFVDQSVDRLERAHQRIERARQQVLASFEEGHQLLLQWLRYGSDHADAADEIYTIETVAKNPERCVPAEDVARLMRDIARYGTDFLTYAARYRQNHEGMRDYQRALFEILHVWEAGAHQYGYDLSDPTNERDPEFRAACNLGAAAKEMADAMLAADSEIDAVLDTCKAWNDIRANAHNIEKWRPEHGDQEPLWHATVHMRDLLENGLQSEKPEGRRGLGLYGEQKGLSFTHQPEVAYSILDCLRELWAISNGHLEAADIVERIRTTPGMDEAEVSHCLGKGMGIEEFAAVADEKGTAALYNVYLWLSERDNPVFTHIEDIVDVLKEVDFIDIGVIRSDVRLTGEEEYKFAESEFIVSPSQVLSIQMDEDAPGPERVGLSMEGIPDSTWTDKHETLTVMAMCP